MDDAKVQALRAHQLHQLKKEAIVYYQANGVPLKMEDALNQMFRDRPDCVFGYLANYFEQLAQPPVISGVRCYHCWDARGVDSLAAEVTCRHRNEDRVRGRSRAALQVTVGEHDKPEERDREAQELRQHVEAGLRLVNEGPLRELAEQGLDPRLQRAIDEFLLARLQAEEDRVRAELQRELAEAAAAASGAEGSGASENASPQHQPAPAGKAAAGGSAKKRGGGKAGKEVVIVPDEPREGLFPGCLALSCLSAACAAAGANAAGIPLYRHLRQQLTDDSDGGCDQDWRLPLPMLTILSGGKASPGKSNCVKEYMIVPKPGLPFDRVLRDSVAVYQQVAKALSVKGGLATRFTNDVGALNTVIDRPEAGFDLINDALKALELTDSFDLAANIAGHELFDYEKGKYDLAQGTQKSPDEAADFLDDISTKQASLVALIDPLRRVERDAWLRLCQKASQRCLIVGDATQHRPGRLLDEMQQTAQEAATEKLEDGQQQQEAQPLLTSGWVARLQQRNTITELFDCAKQMRASGQVVIAAVGPSDSGDTAIVDLAVAIGARFLKLGAPLRAERIDKLQRLAEIGEELRTCDQLSQWEHLSPKLLRPRGSETPEGEQQQQQQQQPRSDPQPSAGKSRKSSSSASKA